eukprot:3606713-Rhodomonas_salina.2
MSTMINARATLSRPRNQLQTKQLLVFLCRQSNSWFSSATAAAVSVVLNPQCDNPSSGSIPGADRVCGSRVLPRGERE